MADKRKVVFLCFAKDALCRYQHLMTQHSFRNLVYDVAWPAQTALMLAKYSMHEPQNAWLG